MTLFSDLKLADPLARALSDLGYSEPTEIQKAAIPLVMKGRDMMGIAQTGTGKTAAFALPALHHIFTQEKDPPKRGARVLVLAPTRELASQITESFRSYGRHMLEFSATTIYGGVPIQRQIKRLVPGNDVLIATPGRLIDLIDRKAITLRDVEMLILDEADQMMDMGFIPALRKIIPLLPEDRQTLLFSATMAPKIKKLAKDFLTDPEHIAVTPPNTTAERVRQSATLASAPEKPFLLAMYLLGDDVERALVFTRTKRGADRVVKRLATIGLQSVAIHGNKSQGQRQRALDAFRSGRVDIMVATDVAARGIDIPSITHVFNYEIPNVPEQYVHRIGRTARAQNEGRAIAFVAPDEKAYLKDIEKLLGEPIPKEPKPDDMDALVKTIKARPSIEPFSEERPPEKRKGRGKGKDKKKKKARFSKGQANKSEKSRHEAEPGARSEASGYFPEDSQAAGKSKRKPKAKSKPSRAERKAEKAKSSEEPKFRRKPKPKGKKPNRAKDDRPRKEGRPKRADKPREDKARGDKPARSGESLKRKPQKARKPQGSKGKKGGPKSGKPNFGRAPSDGSQPPKRRQTGRQNRKSPPRH